MKSKDYPPDTYPIFCEDYALYEAILEHDLAEALRRSIETQTEPAFEPALFLNEADLWLRG